VYVTLGSSGRLDVLPLVLEALAELPVRAVVATAGRLELTGLPDNLRAYGFVPGSLLSGQASVVVSNGGSTTGYQALAAGTPVVGLPANLDQYLAMQAIERAGAGVTVQARRATASVLRAAIARALSDAEMKASAERVAERFRSHDSGAAFTRLVRALAGREGVSAVGS
jgi:UDP:flavonoid glycosyltransferase YjiC (YdhE family)